MRTPHVRFAWSFEREARWMLWLFLVPAALGAGYAVVAPWLRRLFS